MRKGVTVVRGKLQVRCEGVLVAREGVVVNRGDVQFRWEETRGVVTVHGGAPLVLLLLLLLATPPSGLVPALCIKSRGRRSHKRSSPASTAARRRQRGARASLRRLRGTEVCSSSPRPPASFSG